MLTGAHIARRSGALLKCRVWEGSEYVFIPEPPHERAMLRHVAMTNGVSVAVYVEPGATDETVTKAARAQMTDALEDTATRSIMNAKR